MRLVEQTTLVFTRGRTEKVYEIDLCALGEGRFVVNFRYGRRGKALKEGTKTVNPVGEAKARSIYKTLIEQQRAKGYVGGPSHAPSPPEPEPVVAPTPEPEPPPAPTSAAPAAIPTVGDPRARAILARLARGDGEQPRRRREDFDDGRPRTRRQIQAALRAQRSGRSGRSRRRVRSRGDGTWSLNRAIWRAGELSIGESVPFLLPLLGTDDALRDYCIVWSLGRCGDPQAVHALRRVRRDPATPKHVARLATAALIRLLPAAERSALVDGLIQGLPEPLRATDADGLVEALRAHLAGPADDDGEPTPFGSADRRQWAALETLYLADTPAGKEAVARLLPELPLRPPAFQRVRAIFKLAEFRRDGRVFGLCAHRFATTRAMFDVSRRGRAWVQTERSSRRVYNPLAALRSADASLAYGSKTRDYLRRRVWHTLNRIGELDGADYVPLAVGVLLAFSDDDGPRFGHFRAFNRIMGGSAQAHRNTYQDWDRRSRRSRRRRRAEPEPDIRRERFPHLWDRLPAGLMQLIDGSRCRPVHVFAVRALKAQTAFVNALPAAAVAVIVRAPYAESATFGGQLARGRFPLASRADQRVLAAAMVEAVDQQMRKTGIGWIEADFGLLLDEPALLAKLAVTHFNDTRAAIRRELGRLRLDRATGQVITGALIAHLMAQSDVHAANRTIEVLDDVFRSWLSGLGRVLVDLAKHPLATVQSFAARLMADRTAPIHPEALTALLDSAHAEVRVIALRILGLLDDGTLAEASEVLWASLTGRDPAIREAARPIMARLCAGNPAFAERFLQMLIASLLRRRLPDGAPEFILDVLRSDFGDRLSTVPREVAWRLLRSKDGAAQELGGILLPYHLDPNTVAIDQLVELADHEVKAVREASWQAMRQAVPRLKAGLTEAVAVLDSAWEDTRLFAFELFETAFEGADFADDDGAAVLVSVCDSVRPDVQRFGRTLMARHFQPARGKQFLLQLSEHPSVDVQLFASNYLRDHAAGKPEVLERLAPYFTRVLCGINRGRAAKRRAHAFLRDEALADVDAAKVVAQILTRQSATAAIEDRAACLETMAAIARTWPLVELPIRVVEPGLRGA